MLKISIVTPSFNQAGYLRQAIDSVQGQRGPFELDHVVMDGGSTDGSVEVLKSYGSAVRWVSRPDRGQSDALNQGMALAAGDVVGWLNSDDLLEPECLATVAKVFSDEPDTRWLYGKCRVVDADGREIRRFITWYKNVRMRPYRYRRLLAENWISQMTVFWRRSAGEAVGPFRTDLHLAMDYDYWLRLAARWPGRYVDRYLADFRWYPTSKSGGGFRAQQLEDLAIARAHAGGKHPFPIFCHHLHAAKNIAAYTLMGWLRPVGKRPPRGRE